MTAASNRQLAIQVIDKLRQAGYEALLAGGCVRDMLMGNEPADFDVATSATPEQVQALFPKVLMVGAKFGVAIVICGRRRIEVTTFRSDLSYSDGRRPDAVKYVSAREDAARRDFTINGMFFDPLSETVVDYVDGRADLAAGVVRAIGLPEQRFGEDYLRMLRAVRFAARFGFRLEESTQRAIAQLAGRITAISGERVREELEKMFPQPNAAWAVAKMDELGLLRAILPELYQSDELAGRALARAAALAQRQDVLLTLASLLVELPAGTIRDIVRRWGGANELRELLLWLNEHRNDWPGMAGASLAEIKTLRANRDWPALAQLWRYEEVAATGATAACDGVDSRLAGVAPEQIAPPPLLNGADLMAMGLTEGPQLGRILAAVYEAQLNEELATREQALAMARGLMKSPSA